MKNPALHLVALLRRSDDSDWMTLHRFHAEETWRHTRGLGWKVVLLANTAAWPVYAVAQTVWRAWRFGSFARRETGKSIAIQMAEQLHLSLFSLVSPKSYYLFELYRPERRVRALRYVFRYETKAHKGYKRLAPAKGPKTRSKLGLHDLATKRGLPVAPVWLVWKRGAIERGDAGEARYQGRDLVLKPSRGKGGSEIAIWRAADGDVTALLTHLRRTAGRRRWLVQPLLRNHPQLAALAGDALSTVRIVTARAEGCGVEATDAVFKMAADGSVADNAHLGSLAAAVDLVSGAMGAATGLDPTSGHHERHPTRGAQILGTKLPLWEPTVALAVRAHDLFPNYVVLAWDIAITPDGPVLLEANSLPGFHITQRASGVPMGESRLGQILASHIRRLEQATG